MPDDGTLLRKYLAAADEPCPGCGYSLRGLTGDRCPECNQALVLRVRLAEPHLGALITTVAGAAAGLGFNGLLFLYFLLVVVRRGAFVRLHEWISLPIAALLCGLILWWALAHRGRLSVLGSGTRAALPVAAWLITLVSAAIFFAIVR